MEMYVLNWYWEPAAAQCEIFKIRTLLQGVSDNLEIWTFGRDIFQAECAQI